MTTVAAYATPSMTALSNDLLPPEIQLALAHTRPPRRDALTIFFDFDLRLGRILAGTNEPMLGQMRLAWWRDTLSRPVKERPSGDRILDAMAIHWAGRERALIDLVDGWEELLTDPPLGEPHARKFAEGRVSAMRAAFGENADAWDECGAGQVAWFWAMADLATSVSQAEEREMLVEIALKREFHASRIGSPFKGVALLGALALRSLENGGRPLMEGRGASVVALRAAIFGR